MKVMCQCGHPQVLHMGPAGPCRVVETFPNERGVYKTSDSIRCSCSAFKLVTAERERADLG